MDDNDAWLSLPRGGQEHLLTICMGMIAGQNVPLMGPYNLLSGLMFEHWF